MNLCRKLFITSPSSDSDPIDDLFKTQRFFLLLIGVCPTITTLNGIARRVVQNVQRFLQVIMILIVFHVVMVFGWTFYIEMDSGSFASISFALSQATIFSFATFSLVYMMLRTKAILQMMEHTNTHFKGRSANGIF